MSTRPSAPPPPVMDVHSELMLYITEECFFVVSSTATADSAAGEYLIIDRVTGEKRLENRANRDLVPPGADGRAIYGLVGVIRLIAGPYLVVVTKRAPVGQLCGSTIWRLAGFDVIPFAKSLLHLTPQQQRNNDIYLGLVCKTLATPSFFFSYSFDLSHTLQRLHNTSPDFVHMPLHERADQRFVWNKHLLKEFASHPELYRFCIPFIHGFVSIINYQLPQSGESFTWSIVSRRHCDRAGTRMFYRGIDGAGNSANYVETEQIVEARGSKSSFVQVRGSIPLFWTQYPNLKYKPKPALSPTANHVQGYTDHLLSQVYYYGKVVMVNLINQHGSEGVLEKAFANAVRAAGLQNVSYEAFDFHKECPKLDWSRLNVLLDRLSSPMDDFGYFLILRDQSVFSEQAGAFRINCIDSLDRTNVVQSMLARRNLEMALRKMNLFQSEKESIAVDHPSFDSIFRGVWADHADAISVQYAGTGALKTDFTRFGKRTFAGLINDGANASMRYYYNNFADGIRQDGIDFFLGKYQIREDDVCTIVDPLDIDRSSVYWLLLPLFLVAVGMWLTTLLVMSAPFSTEGLLYLMFWGIFAAAIFMAIMRHGREFVNWPRLVELDGHDAPSVSRTGAYGEDFMGPAVKRKTQAPAPPNASVSALSADGRMHQKIV